MSKYFHVSSITEEVKKVLDHPYVAIPIKDGVSISTAQRVIYNCTARLNIPSRVYTAKAITSRDEVMTLVIVESKE